MIVDCLSLSVLVWFSCKSWTGSTQNWRFVHVCVCAPTSYYSSFCHQWCCGGRLHRPSSAKSFVAEEDGRWKHYDNLFSSSNRTGWHKRCYSGVEFLFPGSNSSIARSRVGRAASRRIQTDIHGVAFDMMIVGLRLIKVLLSEMLHVL